MWPERGKKKKQSVIETLACLLEIVFTTISLANTTFDGIRQAGHSPADLSLVNLALDLNQTPSKADLWRVRQEMSLRLKSRSPSDSVQPSQYCVP